MVGLRLALGALFVVFHCTLGQSLVPRSLPSERLALLQLRSSLGLRARDWPRKADHCSNWTGVRCQNGRVVGIHISGFARTRLGAVNPQFAVDPLANLTSLSSFNSSGFALPGPIPAWFGLRLAALRVLDLSSCSIVGTIPRSLGNLTNLTALSLSHNRIGGVIPSSLGQLQLLSFLGLSHNLLNGSIPSPLFSLRNLSRLDVSSNTLFGAIPSSIGALSSLRFLNLSNNGLSSSMPPQLGNLVSLVEIDLSSNLLSGPLPTDLRRLSKLQKFVVRNNTLVSSLPGGLFSGFTSLQMVILSDNKFNGSLPDVLWSMPLLRVLDISNNAFTGNLANARLNSNTKFAVLNISGNLFYGGLPMVLTAFSSIDLARNYFEGRVPDYAQRNVSFDSNCLQDVSNQRNLWECKSFYAERNLVFDDFGRPNNTQRPASPSSRKSQRKWIILGAVLGGAGLIVLLLVILVLLFICCRRTGSTNQRGNGVGPVPEEGFSTPRHSVNFSSLGEAFTYQQMLLATDDFSDTNLIKHGHSGDLFQGILESGILVVIKRVDLNLIKKEAHLLELECFRKASHARLVPLVGHCFENETLKFLVYKYMPNGDLSNSLYRKKILEDDSLQSLDWITRLKIAIGAAEGLSYLHHECTPPLVHRDVQASSILLDDKFEVRLGSLSEVSVQGDTHQHGITRFLQLQRAPEQGPSGASAVNCAYDVYCFGKVLLELITGKLGIGTSGDENVKEWLDQTLPCISIYDKELVTKIVDPSLIIDEDLLEEVWAMAIVARSCLNPKSSKRPLMRHIVKALENPLKVVREENFSSERLRTTSSRGSWNATLFGSWRLSLSDPANRAEAGSSYKRSGTGGSHGSGHSGGGDPLPSQRRHSKEVFPEPASVHDVERPGEE